MDREHGTLAIKLLIRFESEVIKIIRLCELAGIAAARVSNDVLLYLEHVSVVSFGNWACSGFQEMKGNTPQLDNYEWWPIFYFQQESHITGWEFLIINKTCFQWPSLSIWQSPIRYLQSE